METVFAKSFKLKDLGRVVCKGWLRIEVVASNLTTKSKSIASRNLSRNVKPPKIKMTFLQCLSTGNEVESRKG